MSLGLNKVIKTCVVKHISYALIITVVDFTLSCFELRSISGHSKNKKVTFQLLIKYLYNYM